MLSTADSIMTASTEISPSIADRVRIAAAALQDRKGVELKVLYLEPVSDFADYFVLCSGTNQRQVQALAEGVDEALRAEGLRPRHVEGLSGARWVLLDYGDFLVHVFDQEQRDFYALDRLWGDAENVTQEMLQ
jgi:ribosome-associated protein